MRARSPIPFFLMAAAALACGAIGAVRVSLAQDSGLGRSIYVNGTGSGAVQAFPSGENAPFPGSMFTCAGCHGFDGRGKTEAGWRVPDIRRAALGADFEARVHRAVEGTDSYASGQRMPRFEVNERDFAALLSYLSVIGTPAAPEPGVTESTISILVALPVNKVACAQSRELRQVLQQKPFEELTYGRRLTLEFFSKADPARPATHVQEAFAVLDMAGQGLHGAPPDAPVIHVSDADRAPQLALAPRCAALAQSLAAACRPVMDALNRTGRALTRGRFKLEFKKLRGAVISNAGIPHFANPVNSNV